MHLSERFGKFIVTVTVDSLAEILQHLLSVTAAYRKNKRKTKLFGVGLIEGLKPVSYTHLTLPTILLV